ncbi:hypothetical protein ES707_01299 [subsurface metagenome]
MAINLSAKSLLQRYGQTKQIEIERLLSQYGTSLKETREMYPQLLQNIEQRRLATAFPTQELFFTATEAAQMGLSLQEGWMMKMKPNEAQTGYGISFISPQKWELTEDDFFISPTGEKYSKADIQALLSMPTGGLTEELIPPAGPLGIENLTEEGQSQYQEYQAEGGELDVGGWIDLRERQQLETEEIFGAVFPEQDISEVLTYLEENPEGFLADIREIGPTEDMVALLKTLEFEDEGIVRHYTDEEIEELFGAPVPEYVPESWIKDNVWDPFIAGAVAIKQGIETLLFTHPPSPPSEAVPFPWATKTTAIEPEYQFAAAQSLYEYGLQNTIAGYQRRRAENDAYWASHPELTPNPEYSVSPFDNPSLLKDPGYIAYTISNSLAYTLAVMGTIVGVSAVATPFVGIPAGLLVAGMPEAGSMIDELVDMGVPIEQVRTPATLYGLAVGGIETVSDLPFIGLIFKPIGTAVKPMWNTIFKGVANRLAKSALTGLTVTQIEGLEEAVTQVVHNAILKHYDETQSILEGVSHAYIQGVIASTPFGAIGGGASYRTFRANLSQETGAKYDGLVNEFKDAGLTEQQAQVQAVNELAKTPDGEAELSKAIEAAQEEYWEEHPELTRPSEEIIMPEMAESVLQDIKVAEEIAKKVTPITPEVTVGQFTVTLDKVIDETIEEMKATRKWVADQRMLKRMKAETYAGDKLVAEEVARVEALKDRLPTLQEMRKNAEEYLPRLRGEFPNIYRLILDRGQELKIIPRKAAIPEAVPEVKEPWQMTREEYVRPPYTSPAMHKFGVEKALSEGKPVPTEVLKDYPDLAKVPTTEVGMPEVGLQPSMLKEVPAKEVRPEARGKLVQSRMDDYLRLREYNDKAVTGRISEIKKILEAKGRTPKGEATRGNLRLELARLEALQEVAGVDSVEELDLAIRQVSEELGLRSMPYAGYGGKSHMDLLRSPTHRLFKEYTSRQLEEMLKVYQEARQTLSPEIPATSIIKAEDIPTDIPALTSTQLTPQQIEKTIDLFKEAVVAPGTDAQRAAALELRKHVFAQRARAASESAEAMIAEGMNPEEAIKAAEQQFMTGKLPDVTTDYFNDLTQEMRNVLFAKVYNYWKDKSWTELISAHTALTNALAGQSISREVGTGTKYFPEGGSAWDRLTRVFVGDIELLETLDQGKSLSSIIEGVYLETGRGSVPLNQDTVNWLTELATISEEDKLLLTKPLSEITEADVRRIAQSWFYQRRQELQTLLREGVITEEEYKLQLAIAKDKAFPHKPIAPFEAPISEAFEQLPLLTFREKGTINRTLKNIGLTIMDIGNALRALKATCDLSYYRQIGTMALRNPVELYRSSVEAWKALWSQEAAEANWEWVKRQPSFPYYTEMVAQTGQDFLRMFEAPKGTAQWMAAEEFGYLTGERPIPRFMARQPIIKIPGRHFVVGINTFDILVYNKCLKATMQYNDAIASGKVKLKEGEAFSIQQDMNGYGKAIAWMTQRASLGKARALAPEASAIFFAVRSKLGRFLTPKLLIDSNPRVRAFAWQNLSTWVGLTAAFVMLGWWLGLWDVERDPRNAELMSIRIGNLRIDPWAGNRQFAVLYSRLITGIGLSSVTGQEYEVNPIAAFTTFFRSSFSPLLSILLDFWTGKNFIGEEVDIANPKQWLERIAPFAVQDIWEAFQEDWQKGVIAILPAIMGEGVQTYTGDWRENWEKLGLPKYPENTGYGIDEPVYDLADFWADTSSGFRGVDPATLTESKGFPEYVRSIAQALQIIEEIGLLPNKCLTSINADPEEGTTFKDYYQMWQDRQKIVASGDEEKLKAFDADERTRNAYLGNMTQAQYALLMEYHSLPESEQAEFLGEHPEIYADPRDEWLRTHPDENALLALWDKANIYSLEALSKMESLAKSLGIPENAIAFEELGEVTKLRIENQHLFDLEDALKGLDDTIKDEDGLTARDRAIQELYKDNPDFRDDMRRIEAISQGTKEEPTPEDIVEGWVERGVIVDEYGAGSAEAKLWLIDNREAHQWALGEALLTDDGTGWNEPILRLLVQYRDDFDLHEAYGDMASDNYISEDDQRVEARRILLFDEQGMTSFGKAYYTQEASSQGYSESSWPAFVEYSALPIWGSWRERLLLEDENVDFYKEYTDPNIGNHALIDTSKVKPLARDKIYQQFLDEFQAWDETGGMAPKTIENMRAGLDDIERGGMAFMEARYRVQAYDVGVPEKYIDLYAEYYELPDAGYEQEWFFMDNVDYYRDVWLGVQGNQPKDFSEIPTREVWNLYQTYQSLPSGGPRLDFRAKHPELDAWLVSAKGYTPIEGRGSAGAPPTPWEEAAQVEQFKESFK